MYILGYALDKAPDIHIDMRGLVDVLHPVKEQFEDRDTLQGETPDKSSPLTLD